MSVGKGSERSVWGKKVEWGVDQLISSLCEDLKSVKNGARTFSFNVRT